MKRRMAFLLALVMALALAIGVMPASAVTERINTSVGNTFSVSVEKGFWARVQSGISMSRIQLLKDDVHTPNGQNERDIPFKAIGVGEAYIEIYSNATGDVEQTIMVYVAGNNNAWADLGANGKVILSSNYTKSDIFPTETFRIDAQVKDSNGNVVQPNRVSYNWSVSKESGGQAVAELVNSSSGSATFRIKYGSDVPNNPGYIHVTCTVTGANNSKASTTWTLRNGSFTSENSSGTGGNAAKVKVYGGTVEKITYIDAKTNQEIPSTNLQQISYSIPGSLPREFHLNSGDDVGYTTGKVIDHAYPSRLNFDANSLKYFEIEIYVRDATAWDNRPTQPDYGSMGYVVLNQYYANNPYVIMVGIEAMNNLEAMNVGDTQQITADMLGGVPVNAPGMSYKVADESIADVTQDGLVRGKKAGMTMLRVFCGDHEVINKQIFVLGSGTAFEDDPIIDEDGLYFGITSVTRSLEEKGDVRFRVSAKNLSVDGEKIGHDEVEWSSSDTSVARVDDEGYVSIRKVGECYIYGTYTNEDGKEFTSRFKVVVEE